MLFIIVDIMDNLHLILIKLGLSEKDADIYLAILELGEASVIEIAKKTKIKRTTIYNLLPTMIENGLVKSSIKKKRRFFFIDNPSNLKLNLEEKLDSFNKTINEFKAIQNVLPYKPKITFYEGEGGMKELYQDTLDSLNSGDTILSYTGLIDFYKVFPKDFAQYYIQQRVKKKIRIRIITPLSSAADEWKKNSEKELREIKIVNNSDFNFNADTEIYGNKIALISYKENFMGVIIESKEINQMQRMAFEIMWKAI